MPEKKLTKDDKRRIHVTWAKKFAAVVEERERLWEDWKAFSSANPHKRIPMPVLPDYPGYPSEAVGLRCGAKTRAGTPCKRRDLYDSGRCRLHGGLSTGPVTEEGKKRAAANGFKPKNKQTP